ncbi:uncharacterized protein LOC117181034 [Belonocnema kinseyi]|uniref:uncharacterized protein LOC117181034 n=1 Tax=Belonocnema kinseyi TaxID=2817044 RepID=UPI00143D57CB|nr:uncharacterized protein LOC117181034 [Belonocnema kinseyi]
MHSFEQAPNFPFPGTSPHFERDSALNSARWTSISDVVCSLRCIEESWMKDYTMYSHQCVLRLANGLKAQFTRQDIARVHCIKALPKPQRGFRCSVEPGLPFKRADIIYI